jgi:hypothetical protein
MKIPLKILRFIYRKIGKNFHQNVRNEQNRKFALLTKENSNEYFKSIINSGEPSMITRLGTPESNCLLNYLQVVKYHDRRFLKRFDAALRGNLSVWNNLVKKDLQDLVGFFPTTEENLLNFSSIYSSSIADSDGIGVWGYVPGENFIIRKYCPEAIKYDPEVLDPYFFGDPWTSQLKSKKVLVIHPFADSIKMQYKKRDTLFLNKNILPDFELQTVKAVQSIAGNKTPFKDWFDAFEYTKSEINKIDFEVALIAAGSYGLPLASYVKSIGKCAIHMGGSLQILFGIKGKRWDEHPATRALYNDSWVRPNENEIVKNSEIVEGGCYW